MTQQKISALDLAWEAVNALGGACVSGDITGQAYNTAIDDALGTIEKLGGKDPAPARAAGATVETADGGPAFPGGDGQYAGGYHHYNGMSLRDWFAGQALAGLLAADGPDTMTGTTLAAGRAYDYADAMLAERAKR